MASEGQHGVLKYPNGFIYEGALSKDVPYGQGKLTLRDGKVFEGEFVNGVLQGQPRSLTTLWYHYEGDMLNGEPHGQGKKTFQNGEVWEGEFCESIFVGRGKISYPDGRVTEGEFRNNLLNGFGVDHYADGERVETKYIDGKWDGVVKRFYPNGGRKEIFYVRGEQVGTEVIVRSNGCVIEGKDLGVFCVDLFSNATYYFRHGPFKFIDPSGFIDEGEYKYGLKVGRWTYTKPNGDVTTEDIHLTLKQRFTIAIFPSFIKLAAKSCKDVVVEILIFNAVFANVVCYIKIFS